MGVLVPLTLVPRTLMERVARISTEQHALIAGRRVSRRKSLMALCAYSRRGKELRSTVGRPPEARYARECTDNKPVGKTKARTYFGMCKVKTSVHQGEGNNFPRWPTIAILPGRELLHRIGRAKQRAKSKHLSTFRKYSHRRRPRGPPLGIS